MSEVAVIEDPKTTTLLVQYEPADAKIAELKTQLAGLKADTPAGYEQVRKGIATTRNYRVAIEKRRVELKAEALSWGRKVDAEAHRLTDLLLEVERPLSIEKMRIDEEKERKRRDAEEAERARVVAEEKAMLEAEEARLRAIRAAEEEDLRIERERLAVERAKVEAERKAAEEARLAEQQRVAKEQAKIEAERKLVEKEQQRLAAERDRLERMEFERQAKIRAEKEAREQMERERIDAVRRRKAEADAAEMERQQLEASKPDIKKIHEFGQTLRDLPRPDVSNKTAHQFMQEIDLQLLTIVTACEQFTVKKGKKDA
jgi:chromosome segregation ATPase